MRPPLLAGCAGARSRAGPTTSKPALPLSTRNERGGPRRNPVVAPDVLREGGNSGRDDDCERNDAGDESHHSSRWSRFTNDSVEGSP